MAASGRLVFRCYLCSTFQSLSLKALLSHYNAIHSHELNFEVKCGVNDCPAQFRKFNTLYKHVLKRHKEVYEEKNNTSGRETFQTEFNISENNEQYNNYNLLCLKSLKDRLQAFS